jgi:hypothetical protein
MPVNKFLGEITEADNEISARAEPSLQITRPFINSGKRVYLVLMNTPRGCLVIEI